MLKVVIDTNILYSLVGLSENRKVTESNINDYTLSITTTSVIEAIVKHHDDLPSIKKCIEPIITGDIELISIGHTPISNQCLLSLFTAKEISDASDIIEDVRSLKISREAEFYRFILILVVSGLFEVIREDGYKFDNDTQNSDQLNLFRILLESNMDLFLDFFKNAIRKGYDEGREQQAALNAFQIKIFSLLKMFHLNYHMVKTNSILSIKSTQDLSESLDEDNFDKKFKRYIDSPISYVSKKKYHAVMDNYLKDIKDGISDLEGLTEKSLNFLLKKIEKSFKDKSKIRKNDIFDFLIVISLNIANTKIATLDKDFLAALKDIDKESHQLCVDLGFAI